MKTQVFCHISIQKQWYFAAPQSTFAYQILLTCHRVLSHKADAGTPWRPSSSWGAGGELPLSSILYIRIVRTLCPRVLHGARWDSKSIIVHQTSCSIVWMLLRHIPAFTLVQWFQWQKLSSCPARTFPPHIPLICEVQSQINTGLHLLLSILLHHLSCPL